MNATVVLRFVGRALPCAFLVAGLLVEKAISATFIAAGLLGLFVAWRAGLFRETSREDRWLAAAFAVFVAATLVSASAGGFNDGTLQEIEAVARYLLVLPAALFIRWARPPSSWIWGAAMAGAAAAGLYGLYHIVMGPEDDASFIHAGVRHHIRFGVGAVTLAFLGLTAFRFCLRRGRLVAALPAAACLLGLVGAVATGSRTSWLAVPVLLVIALWWLSQVASWRLRAGLAGAVVAGAALVWFVPQTGVQTRVAVGIENVRQYNEHRGHVTSVGARLEMWKAAVMIFRAHPILGVGVAGYSEAVAALEEEGRIRPTTQKYVDPHNEYLAVASSRGVVGLLALLLLWGVPARLFLRGTRSSDPDRRAFAFAGLMVVVGFAVYGLTHTLSVRTFYITWYAMLVALLHAMSGVGEEAPARSAAAGDARVGEGPDGDDKASAPGAPMEGAA